MTVDPWHVAWLEAEQAQVSGHAVRDVVRVEAPEAPERRRPCIRCCSLTWKPFRKLGVDCLVGCFQQAALVKAMSRGPRGVV